MNELLLRSDLWRVFTVRCSTCVIREAVDVSEDLKTASSRDCNLRPQGSVKTKAAHPPGSSSESTCERPGPGPDSSPPVGSAPMSVLSLA